MNVEVKLFAVAKQLSGTESISVELRADATVEELREAISEQHAELRDITARAMIAINAEYVNNKASVPADSEIALIPPVSGG
ncbi:MAG: molybdopterin converting factor subunit 1 [Planctomycetaceae bacterium]|nr:molybdopterin converting factor subunit 1 [Planctomycetaceae bacterium]